MSFSTILDEHRFDDVAARIRGARDADVRRALGRVRAGLSLEDLAALLSPAAEPHLEEMAALSRRLTIERFGRTIQLYAPLYLSNACANVCSYCGFSAHNKIRRKILNPLEIAAEAAVLERHGFQHILLVTGEVGHVGVPYLAAAIRQLRGRFASISIEVQPMRRDDYAALVAEGMSAVLVYQETYDKEAYARSHLSGPKANMANRLDTPDELGLAGVKKVGLGALYGLSDWRADSWFVGLHLRYLETTYWKTRYSISFPRLRPHEGAEVAVTPFGERELVQAACAFRLFSPEVELSLSTRESARFRSHAFQLGFTHLSAGSKTNPGGYTSAPESLEQFQIDDDRSPAEVAEFLRDRGYEPVWKDWDATYDGFVRSAQAAPAEARG
ncbi:2-iminoacetate synthase [mine drainage metagenome]|uniref:2-iminoacetate synthase n=1 Tax=mine drainage metagenome TaxID=410659 RepID=A0A1J5S7D6_9ZZZZ